MREPERGGILISTVILFSTPRPSLCGPQSEQFRQGNLFLWSPHCWNSWGCECSRTYAFCDLCTHRGVWVSPTGGALGIPGRWNVGKINAAKTTRPLSPDFSNKPTWGNKQAVSDPVCLSGSGRSLIRVGSCLVCRLVKKKLSRTESSGTAR